MIHQVTCSIKIPTIHDPTVISIDITVWDVRFQIIKNTREIAYGLRK